MNGGEALVMLVLFIASAGTIFGIWYLRSRENMALIDKGINPRQPHTSLPKPFGNLKYGMLLLGAGLGLTIAFLFDASMVHKMTTIQQGENTYTHTQTFEALYFSLVAVGGGLGLVISYVIERKAWERYNLTQQKEA